MRRTGKCAAMAKVEAQRRRWAFCKVVKTGKEGMPEKEMEHSPDVSGVITAEEIGSG